MSLVSAAGVGLLLTLALASFTTIIVYLLGRNARRRLNFNAIQEVTTRDSPSALVLGSYPEPFDRDPILHYAGAPGHSNEPPRIMNIEVSPVQESLRGYEGTSVRV